MRIASLDVLRGLAVLQMIFWQIFDFFSKADIYTDKPYLISFIDGPVNGLGLALFAFASGASLFISIKNKKKLPKGKIMFHSILRYGGYILLSLLFTTFVFGFRVFYTWNEAIQGIGFAALIASMIILFSKSKLFFFAAAVLISFSQPSLRNLINSPAIASSIPFEPDGLLIAPLAILLNATVRGFFSLTHVLPLMLFGMSASFKKSSVKSLALGTFLVLMSLLMHFTVNKIDVYLWSPSYLLGFSGICFLLLGILELSKFRHRWIMVFGQAAIVAYVFHFVFISKPLQLLKLHSIFPTGISYLFTAISVVIIYFVCKWWLSAKLILKSQ